MNGRTNNNTKIIRTIFPNERPFAEIFDSTGSSGRKIHNRTYTPLIPPVKRKINRMIVESIPKNLAIPPQTPATHLSDRERYNFLIISSFHTNDRNVNILKVESVLACNPQGCLSI